MIAIADCGPTNTGGIVAFSTFDPKRTLLLSSSRSSPVHRPKFRSYTARPSAITCHVLLSVRAPAPSAQLLVTGALQDNLICPWFFSSLLVGATIVIADDGAVRLSTRFRRPTRLRRWCDGCQSRRSGAASEGLHIEAALI